MSDISEQKISFKTAKLAKEVGFDVPCNVVFDLDDDNKEINFYEQACTEFIDDCSTGYRDKALSYFKEYYLRTDDNGDIYYVTRPTQSLLQRWLREKWGIHIKVEYYRDRKVYEAFVSSDSLIDEASKETKNQVYEKYEQSLEDALIDGLELVKKCKNLCNF